MSSTEQFLWSQNYNSSLSRSTSVLNFLKEVISIKLGLIILVYTVIHLKDVKYLGIVLLFFSAYYAYSVFDEVNQRVWNLRWLKYGIGEKGIHFIWGKDSENSLFVPFEAILQITLVQYNKSKWSTIYFDTNNEGYLHHHPFLAEDKNYKLCFDNIEEGKKVDELLRKLHTKVEIDKRIITVEKKSIHSFLPVWLYKVNLCIAGVFFLTASYLFLAAYDYNNIDLNLGLLILTTLTLFGSSIYIF